MTGRPSPNVTRGCDEAVRAGQPRTRRPKQTALSLGDQKKSSKGEWAYFLVGGDTFQEAYIAPTSVPICATHKHDSIPRDLMEKLVTRCLYPGFFRRHCLTSEWRGHAAGSEVLVYGTWGRAVKVDVWVRVA